MYEQHDVKMKIESVYKIQDSHSLYMKPNKLLLFING
jgi:hypothetical protein